MFQENLKKSYKYPKSYILFIIIIIMPYAHIRRRRRRRRGQKGGAIFPLLPLAAAALGPIVGGIALGWERKLEQEGLGDIEADLKNI